MIQSHFQKNYINAGTLLLLLSVVVVFILPMLPISYLNILYPLCFTGIFLISSLSLEKNRKWHTSAAIILTALLFISLSVHLTWISIGSRILQIVYFVFLVVSFVRQIASTKVVSMQVIVHSVTAYFLLGIALIIMATLVAITIPGAYNMEIAGLEDPHRFQTLQNITYYTFVTYTTTGYGDLLPMKPVSKSLAILISSCGQLYIAIIIAMLVGKYSSSKQG